MYRCDGGPGAVFIFCFILPGRKDVRKTARVEGS